MPIVALPAIMALIKGLGVAGAGAATSTAATGAAGKMAGKVGLDSILGLGKGLQQGIASRKSKRAADSFQPQQYDPQQLEWMAEIDQKRKSINTGSAFAADMVAIDATTAGTQQAIVGAAGGDVGGTIQGLLASQQMGNRAKNQVLAQSAQQGNFMMSTGLGLQNLISQRAMEIDFAQQAQQRAQQAQYGQDSYGNVTNAAARIDWGDILTRHGGAPQAAPNFGGDMLNPEQQARQVQPAPAILSMIPVDEAPLQTF